MRYCTEFLESITTQCVNNIKLSSKISFQTNTYTILTIVIKLKQLLLIGTKYLD